MVKSVIGSPELASSAQRRGRRADPVRRRGAATTAGGGLFAGAEEAYLWPRLRAAQHPSQSRRCRLKRMAAGKRAQRQSGFMLTGRANEL